MMRKIHALQCIFAGLLILLCAVSAQAQVNAWWKPTEPTLKLSFSPQNAQRKLRFTDRGLAFELPLQFAAVKHEQFTILAELPEAGQFEIESVVAPTKAQLKNVRAEAREGKAEVSRNLKVPSPKEVLARSQAEIDELLRPKIDEGNKKASKLSKRECLEYLIEKGFKRPDDEKQLQVAYARAWAIEQTADLAREKLGQISTKRTNWVTAKDKLSWKSAGGRELWQVYRELLVCDRADQILHELGLEFETGKSNYQHLLESKLQGVHLLLSGEGSGKKLEGDKIASLLTQADVGKLKQMVYFKLFCRFYPQTDDDDPNSQWYNGQHVACAASGVSLIRVEGKLDPTRHDSVDWWILDRFKPGTTIEFAKQTSVQADPPYIEGQAARLRVVATGNEAVEYSFEFRNEAKSDGLRITIHESPNIAKAKFPY